MDLELKIVSKEINELLWRSEHTLSTAESCTAGRVASVITAIPGSSNFFRGGLVCYAEETKQEILGVDPEIIKEKTAVCEDVVRQMVTGANKAFHSDYAVAVSGFAGPGGGTDSIRVGTIWIAVGTDTEIVTKKLTDDNGRDKNIARATYEAMHMLRDFLREHEPQTEATEEA